MKPRLEVLPPAQLTLWPLLRELPDDFVLYGGTAIALRLGHRVSVDFDFFSDEPLSGARKDRLKAEISFLRDAEVIQNEPNSLTLLVPVDQSSVKVSFFGGLSMGRIARPDKTDDEVACVASLEDLLAHKLKVIHDRAEGKDYQDIAEMLDQGMDLAHGLGGRLALFGPSVPTMTTVKALTWFKDINEPWRLPDPSRQIILEAVRKLPARIPEVEIEAATLRCASGSSYTP
jgi:hypothetical protein